jgi:hypothetical protein
LYVSEIVPPSLSGSLGSFNQMGTVSGFVMAFSIPFILPLPDEPDALTTDLWRVVFMGPAIISMVIITVFTFVFRYDTPLFYKKKGDMINYNKIMNLIYIDYQNEDEDNENCKVGEDIQDGGDREARPSNEPLYSKEGEEISSNAIITKFKSSVLDTPLPNLGTAEPAIIDLNENIKASESEEVKEENEGAERAEDDEGGEGDEEVEVAVKAEHIEKVEKAKIVEIAKIAQEAEIDEVSEKDEVSKDDKSGESGDVPVKSKEWPAHYKKGLFVCGMLSFMFQTTGIDAVIFFSSELFLDGKFKFHINVNHTPNAYQLI